ncbi:DUF5079 family protein [Staphylococcus pettenkoferi]|uniref:DUF5079 family protein n=1 Tax=Staphylococcus pettenkoferi TaxID=170573 RepID=UPI00119DC1AE|nr:DUF5079 family protein [Staphylococcus pettenkoferi]MCY1597564.1 DUF5079 family protein [Staphylococcus pettenkoferi]
MNSFRQLRQPIPQVLALATLISFGLSFANYYFGFSLKETPMYLIVTTVCEIILVILSFIGLLFKPSKYHDKFWLFYFLLSIGLCYTVILSFYNVYFFIAIQNHYSNLYSYWFFGIIAMLIFFGSNILANIIMIKAKNFKQQKVRYLFRMIAVLIYVVYIIIYFIVPDEVENRKNFIGLIFITLCFQTASDFMFLTYGSYKYSIDHEEDPDE